MANIKIGKYTVENLTSGMYEDSKIIYREYIQNAADQIDYAMKNSLFTEQLEVNIIIDTKHRNIYIKDNATGISKSVVASSLANIADSKKIQGEDKGFRGIGRLGGLAYCNKLRFITTAKGENKKTIMTWDANELNKILNDPAIDDDAIKILEKIIDYGEDTCDSEEHFFEVQLLGINKENHDLLDVEEIKKYISLNAPVPFKSNFIYRNEIYNYLKQNNYPIDEYKIYVNDEEVFKPYTTTLLTNIAGQPKKYDDIYGVRFKKFYNDNNELLAWMWYGISRFEKQIPFPLNITAGIRIRQQNIQIGNERTLVPRFKQSRGNLYYIGEVHVVHKQLLPNSRRDYFNENAVRNELEVELERFFCSTLHALYNDASDARSAYKREIKLIEKESLLEKKQGRFVDDTEEEKLKGDVENTKKEKEKYDRKLERLWQKSSNNKVLGFVLKHIEENHKKKLEENGCSKEESTNIKSEQGEPKKKNKKKYLVDELTSIPNKQKKLISRIYAVIKNNLPPKQSEELIVKIQEELKNGKKNSFN